MPLGLGDDEGRAWSAAGGDGGVSLLTDGDDGLQVAQQCGRHSIVRLAGGEQDHSVSASPTTPARVRLVVRERPAKRPHSYWNPRPRTPLVEAQRCPCRAKSDHATSTHELDVSRYPIELDPEHGRSHLGVLQVRDEPSQLTMSNRAAPLPDHERSLGAGWLARTSQFHDLAVTPAASSA